MTNKVYQTDVYFAHNKWRKKHRVLDSHKQKNYLQQVFTILILILYLDTTLCVVDNTVIIDHFNASGIWALNYILSAEKIHKLLLI